MIIKKINLKKYINLILILTLCIVISGFKKNENIIQQFLTFDVMSHENGFERNITDSLTLRVGKNICADNTFFGWDAEVTHKSDSKGYNLLYHSIYWHGPYPSQIYAWHLKEKIFENKRILSVRGYPYEICIELINCKISDGDNPVFTSGTVRITWKKI